MKKKFTIYKLSFIVLSIVALNTYFLVSARAETMSNDLYRITWGNFNMAAGKPGNAQYELSFTAGQLAPGLYSGANFTVRSGFQYISSLIPFAFSINSTSIDFGTLSPANPVTRTNTLAVSNQSAGGYQVTAYESNQLKAVSIGGIIPDTTCDSGTCSEINASAWTSNLTYGFGYRCDIVTGTNYCNSDFSTSTFYKQFADNSKSEAAQIVFSNNKSSRNQQALVTYKVNVSSGQMAGKYRNTITYIATPTF